MHSDDRKRRCSSPALAIWLALVIGAGCGERTGPVPTVPAVATSRSHGPVFPLRDELDALMRRTPPAPDLGSRIRIVDRWTLSGPFPAVTGTTPQTAASALATDLWSEFLIREAASAEDVLPTEEMQCAAREAGLFVLATGGRPSDELLDFMTSRCGALAVGITATFMAADDDSARTDDQVFTSWEPLLRNVVIARRQRADQAAGIWFGRGHGRMAAVIVAGTLAVELTSPIRRRQRGPGSSGGISIAGRLLRDAVQARALVNFGQHRVSPCQLDAGVELPRFTMTCWPRGSDVSSWLELVVLPFDRPFGTTALRLLIWPADGQPKNHYRRVVYYRSWPASVHANLAVSLARIINQIRRQADLKPLSFAPAQSQIAARLAPVYFDAVFDPAKRRINETVALGLMAGWDVPGTVLRGGFSMTISGVPDLSALVSSILARPFGRDVLLDPDAHYLAVGPMMNGDTVGALLATYSVAERIDRHVALSRVLARLGSLRRARGLSPPRLLADADDLVASAVQRIEAGDLALERAVTWLVTRARSRRLTHAWVWTLSAVTTDAFPLPTELLELDGLRIAAALAVHRVPDRAWAHYILVIVATTE